MENGAEILVRGLIEQGVDTVFGYPGGSILGVYDVLRRKKKLIRHIMCTHEQFSVHAADGYARSSGKVGVVLATSGPGATNLVTGIANAFMDSIPLVAVTGNVPVSMLGRDSFQEVDITGITMPITKHNFIVKEPSELEQTVRDAFRIAESGRKGPVLIDIPKNIFEARVKQELTEEGAREIPPLPVSELEAALGSIGASKRPFICAGGGVIHAGASEALKELALKLDCPVALTAMGKGAFPAGHRLYAGIVGTDASETTLAAIKGADLFIGIGIRFSERLLANIERYASGCRVLHIDIDRAEIGKNLDAFCAVTCDALRSLQYINGRLEARGSGNEVGYRPNEGGDGFIYGALNEVFPDAIYTTEVGLHQMDACRLLRTEKAGRFITSGGLGAMGFGLPAAIGAAIANPGTRVINIAGDGSFNMNMQELATAAKYSLPVIELIVNNGSLGMIERWQDREFGGRHFECSTGTRIDYELLAKSFGIKSARVFDGAGLKSVLEGLKEVGTPVLVEVVTDKDGRRRDI